MFHSSRALLLAGVLTLSANAGVISLVTSAGALGTNDTITWGQLGAEGATIPHTFSATSGGGTVASGAFATTTGQVIQAGSGWTPVTGDFSNGDMLIWAFDNGTNAGTGPVTFGALGSVLGVGAAIQADVPGLFTVKLELFNGASSLGSVTRTSNANGDAIFVGGLDTAAEITKAVFSLTAAQSNGNTGNYLGDFALDTLNLTDAPTSSTPEPGSGILLGGALAVFALKLRRRS